MSKINKLSRVLIFITVMVAGIMFTATDTEAAANNKAIQDKICRAFGSKCSEALIIAKRESGFRCNASHRNKDKRRTQDVGLFQVNTYWQRNRIKGRNPYNCDQNIQIAKEIYKSWGNSWRAWATYKYLPRCY